MTKPIKKTPNNLTINQKLKLITNLFETKLSSLAMTASNINNQPLPGLTADTIQKKNINNKNLLKLYENNTVTKSFNLEHCPYSLRAKKREDNKLLTYMVFLIKTQSVKPCCNLFYLLSLLDLDYSDKKNKFHKKKRKNVYYEYDLEESQNDQHLNYSTSVKMPYT